MFTLLLSFSCAISRTLPEGSSGRPELFPHEAAKGWQEYDARARRLQGYWTDTSRIIATGEIQQSHYELKQGDGCWLIMEEDSPANAGDGRGAELKVINRHYAFTLQRRRKTSAWFVSGFGKGLWTSGTLGDPKYVATIVRRLPFTFGAIVFTEPFTLLDEGFSIKKVAGVKQDGQDLVKIEFRYQPPKSADRRPLRGGWVLLDPSRFWTIRQFDVETQWGEKSGRHLATFTYRVSNGFPMIEKIVNQPTIGEVSAVEFVYDFDLHEGDPPDSDFTLSAFGFPEPKGAPLPDKGMPWIVWIAAVAVASLLLGTLLRRWLKKASSRQILPPRPDSRSS